MADQMSEAVLKPLRNVAFAADRFEPFPREIISVSVLDRLVADGLVEAGSSCRPAVGPVGYRLTDRGWKLACERWTERTAEF